MDIRLRQELLTLLPNAGLEASHLITLDDLPAPDRLAEDLKPENTGWVLVDHNKLQGILGSVFHERVLGVIDHHKDEDCIPKDNSVKPRIIEPSGSCASLVTDYCRDSWDRLSVPVSGSDMQRGQRSDTTDDKSNRKSWDAELAKLVLAPVLIDTNNLKSQSKVTLYDVNATEYLEAKVMASPTDASNYARKDFYKAINRAKKDIGVLNMNEILRKDYKEWIENGHKLGISTIVRPLRWQLQHAVVEEGTLATQTEDPTAFGNAVRTYAESKRLSIYAILTTSALFQGEMQRELLLWAFDSKCVAAVSRFGELAKDELKLDDWQQQKLPTAGPMEILKVWRQRDVEKSRKQVAPLLRQCIQSAALPEVT